METKQINKNKYKIKQFKSYYVVWKPQEKEKNINEEKV